MADFPAIPLWTDAYLADTRHLSTLQHGAYLLLLMEAWRRHRCALPNDDGLLSKLSGLSADDWEQNKSVILAFWTLDKRRNEIFQKRLRRERSFVDKNSAKQRDRALKRWNKKTIDDAAAMPERCRNDADPAMPERCRNDAPTPTPTIIPKAKALGADLFGKDGGGAGDGPERAEPPASGRVLDPVKAVADVGVRLLGSYGIAERRARSTVFGWHKRLADAPRLLEILVRAGSAERSDIVAFVEGCLRSAPSGRGGGEKKPVPEWQRLADADRRRAERSAASCS